MSHALSRFSFIPLLTYVLLTSPLAWSQPRSISPADIAETKRHTSFSNNWSTTPLYDLEHPVELLVTLHDFNVPRQGYGELVFTVDSHGEGAEEMYLEPERKYIATLPLVDFIRDLHLNERKLSRGVQARLLGWPVVDDNQRNSVVLVDELELLRGGELIRFQPIVYPTMKKHRKSSYVRWKQANPDSKP